MIEVKIHGGLGNQMFQYALGRTLSISNETKLVLDTSAYKNNQDMRSFQLDYFNIKARIETRSIIRKFINNFAKKQKTYTEKTRNFDPTVLDLKNNIYLDGYWQSFKYFKHIKDVLQKDFSLSQETSEDFKKMTKIIAESKNQTVAMHIRRGDYVHTPNGNHRKDRFLSKNYFDKSLEITKNKLGYILFFVFSDDIPWAKKNLNLPENTIYVSQDYSLSDPEELILISQCSHCIISNSSFSWWGAWLSDHEKKLVISPQKWIPNDESDDSIKDRVPEHWILI